MTVVTALDIITAWVQDNICSKILLKVPPDDDTAPEDAGYEYKRVTPTAFALYVPTKDKLPLNTYPYPSICVRLLEGQDELAAGNRNISVQMMFSTWDPGKHGQDELYPKGDGWYSVGEGGKFERNGGGWRDAWNMVDIALREIESVTNIGGVAIDRSVPLKFGPLTEQEAIPDFYPFWFAWVSFSITSPITRNLRDIENLL